MVYLNIFNYIDPIKFNHSWIGKFTIPMDPSWVERILHEKSQLVFIGIMYSYGIWKYMKVNTEINMEIYGTLKYCL